MKYTIIKFIKDAKNKLFPSKFSVKLMFLFMGIGSTVWFLIRVIPKPQRAGYPCMRAAAPIMSGFVIYLLSLGGAMLLFRKAINKFKQARFVGAGLALLISFILILAFNFRDANNAYSNTTTTTWTRGVLPDGSNNPMGVGWGVFPGRVAWIRNADATNENCTNTFKMTSSGWFQSIDWVNSDVFVMEKNNNQEVINDMADKSVIAIGGKETVKDSWDAIFKSFNNKRKGIETGYTEGQTIFIKINSGQAGWNIDNSDLSEKASNSNDTGAKNVALANTTPATVLAYVRQLVDECGIPQNKIYIGEPMTHVYKSFYDLIHKNYPNVIVLDKDDRSDVGRTKSSGWKTNVVKYSDKGSAMPDALNESLMNELYNADYMINIAALKAHARGGVTLTSKLHFGSHGPHNRKYDSFHLHAGLISVKDNDRLGPNDGARTEYGMYRVLTDIMGHEKLGLNTVLFVVDGLWGGTEATDMPVHWKSAPFNDDFPNSLFVSQDEVAVQSVCIDFLRAEANVNSYFKDRPFFPAVDDFLHQAADKTNWPTGITYDPEGDGSEMPSSLGVHEHWNNDTDKKYSKNLDANASGIEMFSMDLTGTIGGNNSVKQINNSIASVKVFPNPCTDRVELSFNVKNEASVELTVINSKGQITHRFSPVQAYEGAYNQEIITSDWERGNYIILMKATSNKGIETNSTRLMVK